MSSTPERDQRAISKETILTLYLPAAIIALGTSIVAPVIPIYARSFDIGFGTASLVIVVYALGLLVFTLPTGYLMDKLGRRPVLLTGPVITATCAFLTAFVTSFPQLLILRFLTGVSTVMWNHTRIAMITDSGSDRQRGKLITWMFSLERVGMLVGPVLGGFTAAIDIRLPFIIHGILIVLILIPSFKLVKETAPERTGQAVAPTSGSGEWSYVFGQIFKPQVMAFFAAQFMANITRGNTVGILPLYMAFAYNASAQTLGFVSAVSTAIVLPIGFLTGFIMDRYGRKMTVVPGFAFLGVSFFLMAGSAAFAAPFAVFLVTYFMVHASQGITGGNMQVLGSDLAPRRSRGRFFAIWRLFGEGGSTISPIAFSTLTAVASYAAGFSFVGLAGLSVALIIGVLIKETVGRSAKPEPATAAPATPERQPANS
ncbi:MAG: MFS transporter [Dehalococcoidia bacterium]|nr:MFS transporter [Dehalococcoidia bacterium]